MNTLRIALAQINPTVGDIDNNRKRILSSIQAAKKVQADVVVFPELVLSGYPPEDLLHKKHFVDENLKAVRQLAKSVSGLVAVIGGVDRDQQGRLYNAAFVIADQKIPAVYHKHELPNYGVFDEKRYFTDGKQNPILEIRGVLCAVNICEDIWKEDGIPCAQAKSGAKLLLNLSSSPFDLSKMDQREKLLKKRAKQLHCTICYANLVGGQDELVFDGGSMIVGPQGKIVAVAKEFAEDLLTMDVPLELLKSKKTKVKPLIRCKGLPLTKKSELPARGREPLSQLERIYRALVLGTRDYVRKNGFEKVVIGLSGGIDSALVAAIAVEALGKEGVVGVTMPSQFSSSATRSDAKQLAQNLGIQFLELPIQGVFEHYLEVLKPALLGRAVDVTEENLQARVRGNLLMALSNKFGWLVLTTGNKSEIAVGYCTLYGDMSGGFGVIKDVPKTKVYEIARLSNQKHSGWIPESVFSRPPSAELRANQKDQDSLPAYDILDLILEGYVEKYLSISQLDQKLKDRGLIEDVIKKIDRSEYKRRQAPPGIKITPRAFGRDWRVPITNKYIGF